MKWISVEEALPTAGKERSPRVLVWQNGARLVDICYYDGRYGEWILRGYPVEGITHWMPLPDPPK